MAANQKNKIITISLAFGLLIFLIFWKIDGNISGWDMLTARPVPSSFIPTPAPPGPMPSNLPITSPNHLDPLPWGVRLVSKEMPHVEGVIWKTYTNKEYGFEMQYPERWSIDSNFDNYVEYHTGVYQTIFFTFDPPEATYDNVHLTLRRHNNKNLMEYLERYYKELGTDNYHGPVKRNIVINNINWLVENPDEYEMYGELYAEKGDYIYLFPGTSFPTRNERNIVEYMIKSFHFIQ